jgi:acetyl esterase
MAIIIKIILTVSYSIYSLLFWNCEMPEVKAVHKNIAYGTHQKQKLDIIVPPVEGLHPVLIYIHGGGFISGDKSYVERICRVYANRGFLVFNINYRLIPENKFPSQLQDISDAVRWIITNHQKYDGEMEHVIIAGDSSGAYLASWYACGVTEPGLVISAGINEFIPIKNIKGLVLFYGAYDLDEVMKGSFPLKGLLIPGFLGKNMLQREGFQIASPAKHIAHAFPPAFLCAGEKDPLYGESVGMSRKLNDNGVICEILLFSGKEHPEAGHGFLNFYKKSCSKIAMDRSLKFMNDRMSE